MFVKNKNGNKLFFLKETTGGVFIQFLRKMRKMNKQNKLPNTIYQIQNTQKHKKCL